MEILNVDNVTYWYPECDKYALNNVSLKINEGEFVLIVGPSGCGKSTLLRLMNRIVPDFYGGKIKGRVYLKGEDIRNLEQEFIVKNVGIVYQHPEKQIVLNDIEREIAFGLENLSMGQNEMKRNVAEVISLLGINHIRKKAASEISGGEKQKVAIASVLAMNPSTIIFDEPTSQLDPISSEEVLNCIKKFNRDFGKTIVLVEQRLDKCFDMADRIIFMENGEIFCEGTPYNLPAELNKRYFLPNISYIFKKANFNNIPVNVKDGRKLILDKKFRKERNFSRHYGEKVLQVSKLFFEYEKGAKTLKDINFTLSSGEILSVMGENGAGKSTLFKIIAGLLTKYKGVIDIKKKVGYLSQNPNDYLGRKNVFEEVAYTLRNINQYDENKVESVLELLDIQVLKNRNPRDLSGGEKQRVAIACTLVTDPEILILDEPTRGMDALAKEKLGTIMLKFKEKGKAVVLITHDSDFAADYSDTVMLMFDGEVTALGEAEDILCDSIYYSPQIARVFKDKCKVIKTEEAVKLIKGAV